MGVNPNELKAVVKSLNDSGLLKSKIKIVGKKKDEVLVSVAEAVNKIMEDENEAKLSDQVIDFYNTHIAGDDDGDAEVVPEKKPSRKKTAEKKSAGKKPAEKKPAEKKPAGKKPAEKKPAGKKEAKPGGFQDRLKFMSALIDKKKHTLQEVTDLTVKEFPDVAVTTVQTNLRDARNEKNTKFGRLVVMDKDTKILSWG